MNILAVSDIEMPLVYGSRIRKRFCDVDLVIGCGDLPYYYLEYIISMLDIPLYFVRGNHARQVERGVYGERQAPWGAVDLHRRVYRDDSGLLMAGIQGSLRYNRGPYQYTQNEMWRLVLGLVPALICNKGRRGRYLDIFVTHAPPWQIHDMDDRPHQGIKAFRWLIEVFKPGLHLHGHIHVYHPYTATHTRFHATDVINAYGFRELVIDDAHFAAGKLELISPKPQVRLPR